jgi:transposase InsO family protein
MMSDRLVIPSNFRHRILKQLQRGHPGIERMKAVARSKVFWPKLDHAIEDFVKKCNNCATHAKTPPKVPLQSWPQATKPWERIHIDFAGPFFDQYFLVVVDAHSKWPEVKIVQSPTAPAVTEFLDELFSRFGDPETIVSDNGSQFTSDHFAAFCKEHGIQHLRTAPYHPQSNGQAERFVDTLKRSLLKINEGEKIAMTLQVFLQTYRSTPSRTLQGKSPAELLLGRKMRTILSLLQPSQCLPAVVNQQQNEQFNRKHGTVPRSFQAGDKVYAKVYTAKKWIWSVGEVIEAFGNVNYNVLLEVQHGRRKLIRSHANQLKHREADGNPPESASQLSILVDMFGLHPVPAATMPETTVQPPVLPDVPEDPVEVPVENPLIQEALEIPAGPEDEPAEPYEPEGEEAEDPEQPVTPAPPTPESSSEVQGRPQRFIRMPSRFEPYLVFWK